MVQKTGIIVQKKNYTLRTWQTEDAASLAKYLNNKNIWDNCRDGLPYPYSQEDANVFLSMVQAKENIQDFCIEVNGEAVGSIGFVPATDVERFSTEVGYWIGEPFWNQGIVTDALKEAINYYFEHIRRHLLWSGRCCMAISIVSTWSHLFPRITSYRLERGLSRRLDGIRR